MIQIKIFISVFRVLLFIILCDSIILDKSKRDVLFKLVFYITDWPSDIRSDVIWNLTMKTALCLLLTCLMASFALGIKEGRQDELRKFPDDFLFGVATAAYQIEGAWNISDKSENIWDRLTHTKSWLVHGNANGDVAADSYHLYERDVEMIRELGVKFYRFSIAWSRLLPSGFVDKISEDGLNYYNNLINELLKYDIIPMATIYHWDLPQKLQDLGGWNNPLITQWFEDYARVVFEQFGDRVKYWVTINEPDQVCTAGYGTSNKAPAFNYKGIPEYICVRNILLSHGKAYHLYKNEFKPSQGGTVGYTSSTPWYEPESDSEEDIRAAQDHLDFTIGLYYNPVYGPEGDYPTVVKEYIAAKSLAQGYPRSRLFEFTPEEVEYLKGTFDFLGLNHYSAYIVYRDESLIGAYDVPSFQDDLNIGSYQREEWQASNSPWLKTVPWGFRKVLNYLSETFNHPEIYVMENGFSTTTGLEDETRATYFKEYISEMLKAILDDGVNIKGYTAWSLMDNFEWMEGYNGRFGLYEVDFSDPERKRTARKSALVYKEIVRSRQVDLDYNPDSLDISISNK